MKKLLIIALVATGTLVKAQDPSFFKGALVISADAGFEAYSVNENYNIIGISNKFFSATAKINTTTSAGGSFEFGLFNWLGIGLQSTYNIYNLRESIIRACFNVLKEFAGFPHRKNNNGPGKRPVDAAVRRRVTRRPLIRARHECDPSSPHRAGRRPYYFARGAQSAD